MGKRILRLVSVAVLVIFTATSALGQEAWWLTQDEFEEMLGVRTEPRNTYGMFKGTLIGTMTSGITDWVKERRETFLDRHFLGQPATSGGQLATGSGEPADNSAKPDGDATIQVTPGFPVDPEQLPQNRAAKTAVHDLAKRLRVPVTEIRVLLTAQPSACYTSPPRHRDYRFTLLHGMLEKREQGDAATAGPITPQPFGIYTYTVRVNGGSNGEIAFMIDGVPTYQIMRVDYFGGAYDRYHYNEYIRIGWIDQYDRDGIHKATIHYTTPTANDWSPSRIKTVIHYGTNADGMKTVKYWDAYEYLVWMMQGGSGTPASGSAIVVTRYRGPVRSGALSAGPLCVFLYKGDPGLEKLQCCTFSDGTVITYEHNLAWDVRDANGETIMKFTYEVDRYGNILSTTVVYRSGEGETYEGLVDPVDVVVGYLDGIRDLIRKARAKIEEHKNNIQEIEEQNAAYQEKEAEFYTVRREYDDLFNQLPPGHPFERLFPPLYSKRGFPRINFLRVYIPIQEALEKSQAEIDIFLKAIEEGDFDTIREHLGVEIKEVEQVLYMLGTYIGEYEEDLAELTAAIEAIQEYLAEYSDLILKARAKIEEHQTMLTALNESKAEMSEKAGEFNALLREYAAVFTELPEGHPFAHMMFPMRAYMFDHDVFGDLQREIEILQKAIEECDLETIREHLDVEIPGAEVLLSIFDALISDFVSYIGQLQEEIAAIKEYIGLYNELIRKARAKIEEHQTMLTALNESKAEMSEKAGEFNALLREYAAVFTELPEGHPFAHMMFPMPCYGVFPGVFEGLQKEIEILQKAIEEGDLETIREHLDVEIPGAETLLQVFNSMISVYESYIGQLQEEIAAIKEYIGLYNDLINKAHEKIGEHREDIETVENELSEKNEAQAEFNRLYRQYEALFGALPDEGHPFEHLRFLLPMFQGAISPEEGPLTPQSVLEKLKLEISVLQKAIEEGDVATIEEHLGTEVAGVDAILGRLALYIELFGKYIDELAAEIAAIEEYLGLEYHIQGEDEDEMNIGDSEVMERKGLEDKSTIGVDEQGYTNTGEIATPANGMVPNMQ